jgi:hypothetical protein
MEGIVSETKQEWAPESALPPYTIRRTEQNLWTVGIAYADGYWEPLSDWETRDEALAEASRLNVHQYAQDLAVPIAAVNACAGVRLASDAPGTVRALIVAAQQALEHLRELEEDWRRGVISEHDGKGGLRSNTNAWRANALRDALAAFVTEVQE